MDTFNEGDIVVLKSGSMKMMVEAVDGDSVAVIWAHEGDIGRDSVPAFTLKLWEDRAPDQRGPRRDDDRGGRSGGGRSYGGDREGGGKPYRGRDDRGDRDEKPRGKPGWDGKPREKKYFRKDD